MWIKRFNFANCIRNSCFNNLEFFCFRLHNSYIYSWIYFSILKTLYYKVKASLKQHAFTISSILKQNGVLQTNCEKTIKCVTVDIFSG